MSPKKSLSEVRRAYEQDRSHVETLTSYLIELTRNLAGSSEVAVSEAILTLLSDLPRHQQVELYEHFFHLRKHPDTLMSEKDKELINAGEVKDYQTLLYESFEDWLGGKVTLREYRPANELTEDHKAELRRLFSLLKIEKIEFVDEHSEDYELYLCEFSLGPRRFRQFDEVRWNSDHYTHEFVDCETERAFETDKAEWLQLQSDLHSTLPIPLLGCFMILARFGSFQRGEGSAALEDYRDCLFGQFTKHGELMKNAVEDWLEGQNSKGWAEDAPSSTETDRFEIRRLLSQTTVTSFSHVETQDSFRSICELTVGAWRAVLVWEASCEPPTRMVQISNHPGPIFSTQHVFQKGRFQESWSTAAELAGTQLKQRLFIYYIYIIGFDLAKRDFPTPRPQWPGDFKEMLAEIKDKQ